MSIYDNFDGEFIEAKKKYMPNFYIKHEEELNELMSIVYWAHNVKEAMFCYLNNLQECPKCESCGGNSKFVGAPKCGQYNRFCPKDECVKYSASLGSSKEALEKRRNTSLERYGVTSPMKNPEILARRDKTFEDNYGGHPWKNDEVREGIYDTWLEKYGCTNPSQNKEIRQKIKDGWINTYGVDNPMKCDEVKLKRENTWLLNYGETHHFKVESIRNKYKETCLNNLGYDSPLKSPEVWNTIRDTLEERYGVRHNMQHPETCERANTSNFRKYTSFRGNEYTIQGYEHFAIELLEDSGIPFVNDRRFVKTIPYISSEGKERRYFPDFKLSNNLYIEVKSEYTFKNSLEKMYHILTHNPDVNLVVWVFSSNGELINTYNNQEIIEEYLSCQI